MLSPVLSAHRSVFEIVRDMLSACEDGGINKTAIMYRSSLSYGQLRRYLSPLCDQGLIVGRRDGDYQITTKGRQTLRQVSNVIKTLKDIDG